MHIQIEPLMYMYFQIEPLMYMYICYLRNVWIFKIHTIQACNEKGKYDISVVFPNAAKDYCIIRWWWSMVYDEAAIKDVGIYLSNMILC